MFLLSVTDYVVYNVTLLVWTYIACICVLFSYYNSNDYYYRFQAISCTHFAA